MRRYLVAMVIAVGSLAGCISTAPPAASPAAAAGGAPPAAPAAPTTSTPGSGTTVNVAGSSTPCCPHQTLWQFLGVKNLFLDVGKLLEALRNCLGSAFPGLESVPPLTAITNPANASSSNPAIAAAAQAKADEDQAGQKIKAIRYLATLGCSGCYPDIEPALLAALDDCTEAVRYEAAKAFRELSGASCQTCKTKSCCSPKVRKKLDEVANKMENNCYKEPSERVRRMARLALCGCGGATAASPTPQEGPSEAPLPGKGANPAKTADDRTAKSLADLTAAPSGNGEKTDDNKSSSEKVIPASVTVPTPADAQPNSKTNGNPASPQVSVSQTPMDCGCGVNTSTSVFIPSSAPATNQQATTTAASGAQAGSAMTAVANALPSLATSVLRLTLPTPAETTHDSTSPTTANAAPSAPAPVPTAAAAPLPAKEIHSASLASGSIYAEVNGQPIFENDVAAEADQQLANASGLSQSEKLRQRPEYIRRQLARVIDRKLLAQEARRVGPQIDQAAFQSVGTDDESLADALLKAVVRVDTNVTAEQMWACYRFNIAKYTRPAEVRYEQVSARIDRFGSRDAALEAMTYIRNLALGLPAGDPPAKLDAIETQTMGWTRRDDIASPEAADLLFRMPIGGITVVLDGGDTLHLERVLERHAAGPAPMEMVAVVVRQQILRERREYLEQAYLGQLRGRAKIWTVFDSPRPASSMVRPASGEFER